MVVALGPGKFYGSSLPRPRIYTDVKLSDERVDPPTPVLDPLLSWANEAHWSMGGLNFKRHRLQGKIEGSVKKLRAEREKSIKKKRKQRAEDSVLCRANNDNNNTSKSPLFVSPPPAPIATKRRRFMALIDDDDDTELEVEEKDEEGGVGVKVRRKSARKLGDDFDRVATESVIKENVKAKGWSNDDQLKSSSNGLDQAAASRTRRSKRSEVVEEVKGSRASKGKKKLKSRNNKVNRNEENGSPPVSVIRTSPRLSKRESL